jgi:hypothetical protein
LYSTLTTCTQVPYWTGVGKGAGVTAEVAHEVVAGAAGVVAEAAEVTTADEAPTTDEAPADEAGATTDEATDEAAAEVAEETGAEELTAGQRSAALLILPTTHEDASSV